MIFGNGRYRDQLHRDNICVKLMRGLRRGQIVRSIGGGACLELAALFCVLPKDSTQPPTAFQEVLGYTQTPGGRAFYLLFGTGLSHQLDKLPQPLGIVLAIIGFAAVFLFQSAIMGLPF